MCYQWVRRGRKVTPDNSDARSLITAFKECDGESRHGIVLWVCRDTVGHSCSTAWVYSFEVPPADGKNVVGTPTRATNSMPRQRLRSIPNRFCPKQSGSKARTISPGVVHRQNHLHRDLPSHGHIGETGIGGRDCLLAARTVEPEFDQRYPLV